MLDNDDSGKEKSHMNHILQDELWIEAIEEWANTKMKDYLHQNHEEYQKLW